MVVYATDLANGLKNRIGNGCGGPAEPTSSAVEFDDSALYPPCNPLYVAQFLSLYV